jgi:Tol biopolymer transport system component
MGALMKRREITPIVASAATVVVVLLLGTRTVEGQATADDAAKPRGGPFPLQLTVYDRQGRIVRTVGPPAGDRLPPVFSPDRSRLAVVTPIPGAPGADISLFDLSTGAGTPLMSGPAPRGPIWSPDGRHVAYFSYRRGLGGLYRKAADRRGSEEVLYQFPPAVSDVHLTDWSPNGQFLVFDVSGAVWLLPLTEGRRAAVLLGDDSQVFGARFSPDGRFLAYTSDQSGRQEVYVRAFDSSSGRFSDGSGPRQVSGQGGVGMVHWRRDGRELYYLAPDGGVMVVDVTTTRAFTAGSPRRLFQAPGTISAWTYPNDDQYGRISPDGQRFAFHVPVPPKRSVITVAPDILARYVGTYVFEPARVTVTVEGNQLMARVPGREKFPYFAESETYFFDRRADGDFDVQFVKDDTGSVTHLVDVGRGTRWRRTEADAKATRKLFPRQLTLYDRQGKVVRTVGEPGLYSETAFSPDGTRLALERKVDPGMAAERYARVNPFAGPHDDIWADIWVLDLSTDLSTPLRAGLAERGWREPVFSPDGSQIAYFSIRRGDGGLYRKASNGMGREQLLYRFPQRVIEVYGTEWSPDGRFLTFDTDGVLWVLSLTGERIPVEIVREEFKVSGARFSRDSRFLAHVSDESGRNEIYVREFDSSKGRFAAEGGRWRVSDQGGRGPLRWRRDGRELYYWAADGGVMAVEVTTTPAFTTGPPRLLFGTPMTASPDEDNLDYDWYGAISPDGERFAFQVPVPPERKVVTVAPEILAQYTGTYVIPQETGAHSMVVALDGRTLTLKITWSWSDEKRPLFVLPLFAESDTRFFARDRTTDRSGLTGRDFDIEFVRDERGTVMYVIDYNGGGEARRWTRQ